MGYVNWLGKDDNGYTKTIGDKREISNTKYIVENTTTPICIQALEERLQEKSMAEIKEWIQQHRENPEKTTGYQEAAKDTHLEAEKPEIEPVQIEDNEIEEER